MRTSVQVAVALVTLLALFGVWMAAVFHWHRSVSPGGSTLAPCLEKLGASVSATVFVHDGNEFLLLVGESRAFPRFPSGPPHYVFDRTGALVNWVPDSGDAENWWERWPGLKGARPITREDLHRWPGAKQ